MMHMRTLLKGEVGEAIDDRRDEDGISWRCTVVAVAPEAVSPCNADQRLAADERSAKEAGSSGDWRKYGRDVYLTYV